MSVLTDPTTYPISPAAARQLERPLFGHVIDGEVVPSLDGATMPIVDPATGEQVAVGGGGLRRRRRARGRAPRATRSTTAAGASWRRSSRSGGCASSPR